MSEERMTLKRKSKILNFFVFYYAMFMGAKFTNSEKCLFWEHDWIFSSENHAHEPGFQPDGSILLAGFYLIKKKRCLKCDKTVVIEDCSKSKTKFGPRHFCYLVEYEDGTSAIKHDWPDMSLNISPRVTQVTGGGHASEKKNWFEKPFEPVEYCHLCHEKLPR